MSEIAYGAKYDRSLSTTEIARRFRADVAAEKKAGRLPRELKLSVKTRYYSGGSSIDVRIKGLPAGFPVRNREVAPTAGTLRFAPELRELKERLQGLLDAYNFDGSDSMTDYFHVNFYGWVEVDSRLEADDA